MQVSVTSTEGLERRMTVGLPADQINQEVQQRLNTMKGQVRLDGFRPGKVPLKVVEKRYGTQVRQEVEVDLMQRSFYEAVEKEELRLASQPTIEPGESGDTTFEFIATFEVYPEIDASVPAGLTIEKATVEIAESDVDAMIDKLRDQRASWAVVERAAENGDQVDIDFLGRLNDVPFEGGEAKGFQLELGSNRFIAGFEEQLIGAKAGDSLNLDVTFPEEYQNQDLAGKPVVFEVTVNAVNEKVPPAIDDKDFLLALGVSDGDINALRKNVTESMQRELEQKIAETVKEQVLDKLLSANEIELPGALVEAEIQQVANQARQSMGMQGEQELTDEVRSALGDRARRRVSLGLLVGELIRKQGFKVDADRVRARIESMAATYDDPASVVNWYYEDKSRVSGVEALVLEDQVVDWVLSQAKIDEIQKPFDEMMQAG